MKIEGDRGRSTSRRGPASSDEEVNSHHQRKGSRSAAMARANHRVRHAPSNATAVPCHKPSGTNSNTLYQPRVCAIRSHECAISCLSSQDACAVCLCESEYGFIRFRLALSAPLLGLYSPLQLALSVVSGGGSSGRGETSRTHSTLGGLGPRDTLTTALGSACRAHRSYYRARAV